MKPCKQDKCKKYHAGFCKKDNPELSNKGICLEYEPDECAFTTNRGKCCEKTVPNTGFCPAHSQSKCVVCGKQAIKECLWPVNDEDGLCGKPLCDNRECFKKHKAEEHEEKPIEIPAKAENNDTI